MSSSWTTRPKQRQDPKTDPRLRLQTRVRLPRPARAVFPLNSGSCLIKWWRMHPSVPLGSGVNLAYQG